MWATGLSYQAFNIYHRHIARAGTILAMVHSVVYIYLFVVFGMLTNSCCSSMESNISQKDGECSQESSLSFGFYLV
jgi:hypothetical protein